MAFRVSNSREDEAKGKRKNGGKDRRECHVSFQSLVDSASPSLSSHSLSPGAGGRVSLLVLALDEIKLAIGLRGVLTHSHLSRLSQPWAMEPLEDESRSGQS